MRRFVLLGAIVIVGAVGIAAQQQDKPLTIEKVRENLFMIRGGGENTAAFITTKGVVLVDTKDPGMGPAIMAQVRSQAARGKSREKLVHCTCALVHMRTLLLGTCAPAHSRTCALRD
jgi:hypothetical protein